MTGEEGNDVFNDERCPGEHCLAPGGNAMSKYKVLNNANNNNCNASFEYFPKNNFKFLFIACNIISV